jgi:hypothetical protein
MHSLIDFRDVISVNLYRIDAHLVAVVVVAGMPVIII